MGEEDELDRAALHRIFPTFPEVRVGFDRAPAIRLQNGTVVPTMRAGSRCETDEGEDLPASWFQFDNGGRRIWSTASGEFEAR